MNKQHNDTEWRTSAAGNLWRYSKGCHLVIGKRKNGFGFWASCEGVYINENLPTERAAKSAAEVQAILGQLERKADK